MSDTRLFNATKPTTISSSTAVGATEITPASIKDREGNSISTMATYFGTKGYGVISPNRESEEHFTFTGISSGVLTGVSHITMTSPYTETSGLQTAHAAGSTIIIQSNTPGFYNDFTNKANDETITGDWLVPTPANATSIANKAYVDGVAIAGAPNALTTLQGLVELSTQAENNAGTVIGGTGASLVATPGINAVSVQNSVWSYGADAGSTDAYAITLTPAVTAYATGQVFYFKVNTANTGASTLNVNGLGAIAIKKNTSVDLDTGDLIVGSIIHVAYDGTNFQLQTPVSQSVSSSVGYSFTAGEDISQGDVVQISSADTVKRVFASALPTTFTQTATFVDSFSVSDPNQNAFFLEIGTGIRAFVYGENGTNTEILRIPLTTTTGAIGTMTQTTSFGAGSSSTNIDAIAIGSNKILACFNSAGVQAQVADLTNSAFTVGGLVTVDNTNVTANTGFCEYISDSHVLFVYQDSSASSIVFAKYTLSGSTLSASSTGTISTLTGVSFTLRGFGRLGTTDTFLVFIQNDTAGSAQVAVATYTQGSSTFSIGSFVNFPSDVDIGSSGDGLRVRMISLSSTTAVIQFPSVVGANTAIGISYITVSGTVPTVGTITTESYASGVKAKDFVKINSRTVASCVNHAGTLTTKVYEISSTGELVNRISTTTTTTPSGGTRQTNTPFAIFPVNPKRTGFVCVLTTASDWEVGTGLLTLPAPIGIASSTVTSSNPVSVITGCYTDDVTGLTAGSQYYMETGGLLTSTSDESPQKILVAIDATEGVINI